MQKPDSLRSPNAQIHISSTFYSSYLYKGIYYYTFFIHYHNIKIDGLFVYSKKSSVSQAVSSSKGEQYCARNTSHITDMIHFEMISFCLLPIGPYNPTPFHFDHRALYWPYYFAYGLRTFSSSSRKFTTTAPFSTTYHLHPITGTPHTLAGFMFQVLPPTLTYLS